MSKGEYEVGYGRPPKAHQFKKGQSGCPTGRPRSTGAVRLDLDALLEGHACYTDAAGRQRHAPRQELLFRKQVERALSGNRRSMKAVLKQLIAHQAVQLGQVIHDYGAVEVPHDIPMPLGCILVELHGRPPWSTKQIAQGCARWETQDSEASKAFIDHRFRKQP
jgi:hypothetical protein